MKLFYANQLLLKQEEKLDTKIYCGSKNIILNVLPLIDRTGLTKSPYDFAIYDDHLMPTPDESFNLSYQECCDLRTKEIIDLANKKNIPIRILWSGGIDSTLVLVSFLKQMSQSEAKEKLVVSLSSGSIMENYFFYNKFVRYLRCESGYNVENLMDGSCIVVTGEYNDQLFGSSTAKDMKKYYNNSYDFDDVYDREKFFDFIANQNQIALFQESIDSPYFDLGDLETNAWLDLLEFSAEKSNLDIITMFDYWWWLSFNFKWQSIYFRLLIRANQNLKNNITSDFCREHLIHFFSSQDFQQWSFHNRNRGIKDLNWRRFKNASKEIIYDFDKNKEYYDYKIKNGSLYRVLQYVEKSLAITDQFNFLNEFDPNDFYQEDNYFNNWIKKNGA